MEFPRTVEEIFKDYKGRRAGILMALTEEADDLYAKCDPERENLALYAEPDGTWIVDLPAEEVPAELPEPMLGINFAREGMARKDFLSLVSVQSDAWLMAVAFYFASKLNGTGRLQLFNRINELQPLFEVLQGKPKMKVKPTPAGGKKRKHSDTGAPPQPEVQEELVIDPGLAPVPPPEFTSTSNEIPSATGRLLAYSDINQALKGRQAELFWPDDNLWYLVRIFSVNIRNRIAKIVYDDLSVEELDLNEIVKEGHMSLLAQ